MNSPSELDFDGFDDTTEPNIGENVTDSELPILEEPIDLKPLECMQSTDLSQCEVCGEKFECKKQLRSHITVHLGQPRVILKRCNNLQFIKTNDTYRFKIKEKKGSLKLTLKKQNHSDFAVINRDLDFDNCESDNYYLEDVAGDNNKKNERRSVERDNEEQEIEQNQFDDVMVNDDELDYPDDNYNNNENEHDDEDDEDDDDDTDENYRPSGEPNESDSGVGSDMANPSEKEDLTVDDLHHSADHYESEDVDKNIDDNDDNDDPEESDALEATCRETIENLKKLGEESSSRSFREADMSPRDDEKISDDSSPERSPVLDCNSALKILSKNLAIEIQTPEQISIRPRKNSKSTMESNSNINWSDLHDGNINDKDSDNTTQENNEQQCDNNTTENNTDTNNSILQEFLDAQKQKESRDRSSENTPIETEYVSLERLAETVSTCRVCNEKFHDITLLDEHKSKAGHYQCNIPDCSNLIFTTVMEVSIHKSQIHGAPLSPSISIMPAHVARSSPHVSNDGSPRIRQNTSPHLSNHSSPHNMTVDGSNHHQTNCTSPRNSSPHQSQSPTFNVNSHLHHRHNQQQQQQQQQMVPPVNFEQLPAPVQQLAQQVQRMSLPPPQSQMPPSLPPGANTMIHGPSYFSQPPGRPPLYRMPGPQSMQYPPHIAHLYSQYNASPYASQYPGQMPQQMPRVRYTQILPNTRGPRLPSAPQPRHRMKRPIAPSAPTQQRGITEPAQKQRRMDLLLPDRNEDADCHVIAQQKRNDGLPVIQNVQGATSQQQNNRSDSTIHLTDSITLSVRQPGSTPSAQVQNSPGNNGKKTDAKAVANVLAARGITVTPAAGKNKLAEQQKQQQPQQQQQRAAAPVAPSNVTALNLNSAISIIPASTQRKQQQQQQQEQSFAVPQNKQNKQASSQEVERPPRPPTVDLTQDAPLPPPYPARRGRPSRSMLTCQICDKTFQNQEILGQHMATHRGTNKLHHKCNLCPAQYPTAQDLSLHKQTYHKEHDTTSTNGGTELAIPVIDLKSPQALSRLSSLGIQSYIPLSQLSAQTGGYFGLPIITIDGPRNPNSCNLGALGATSILSLGPLRSLSNR